jgi:hypothetical protein
MEWAGAERAPQSDGIGKNSGSIEKDPAASYRTLILGVDY